MWPYERWVLIELAVLRCMIIFGVGLVVFESVRRAWKNWAALALAFVVSAGTGFVWADGPEHWLKQPLLGTMYNPFYMTQGEFEGWTGPTDATPDQWARWNIAKCGPPPAALPWWGDPGSGSFCH